MQQIIDKGGYQYGDKVTVYYDPATVTSHQVQRETLETYLICGAATCFACLRLPDDSILPILRN